MRRVWCISVVVALAPAACGNSGGGGADAGPGGAPEFRSVSVTIDGAVSTMVDLTDGDRTVILPASATATFRVFATDDFTSAEQLLVEVVNGAGEELPGQTPSFSNGVWRIELTIEAGAELTARTIDADGAGTTFEHALILPTAAQAVPGYWEKRFFELDQTPRERWSLDVDAAAWTREVPIGGATSTGTLAFDAGELTWQVRTGAGDGDPDTVEVEETGDYYLDDVYFGRFPYARVAGDDGLTGTWERTVAFTAGGDTGMVTHTLDFDGVAFPDPDDDSVTWDGTFAETVETSLQGQAPTTVTETGWYRSEFAVDYNEAFGNFLRRRVNERDGAPVEPPETHFEIHVFRLAYLMFSPWIRP